MKNKKKLFLIIGIAVLILAVAGVTYAMYIKVLFNDLNVAGSATNNLSGYVIYNKETANISGEMLPVATDTSGKGVTVNFYRTTTAPVIYGHIYIDISSISATLTSTSVLKYRVYEGDASGIVLGEGSFEGKSAGDSILAASNFTLNTSSTNYKVFVWLDQDEFNTDMSGGSFNVTVRCHATMKPLPGAATYIRNLYLQNKDKTATVNGITYNLASSVGLMNDRLGSNSTDIDGGNIRYYGADPNNYVWLGDTFTSAYTYTSNGTSITRAANSKKLWRIIGVFDGKLKLVTADPIYNGGLSWDTSVNNTTGGNSGYGINQWGESGDYTGADLMKLLNPGYEFNTDLNSSGTSVIVNNSLYWNKGTGTVYTGRSNATTANISFAITGLSQSEKDKIDTAIWYLGAYNVDASYVNVQYAAERQSATLGKICTSGNNCNDAVTRTATWIGKVGLIYPSDYGYATDLSTCAKTLLNYSNSSNSYACRAKDWLYNSSFTQWTISPRANSSVAYSVFNVAGHGGLNDIYAYYGYRVRPAVYLKATARIASGTGTYADPYVIN